MPKMHRTKKVALAAGVAVVALGLAAPGAADESAGVSALTAPRTERPAVVSDVESPADESQVVSPSEAGSESPGLPTPVGDVELPAPPESFPEVVIADSVVITFAPRPLRQPRLRP